LIDWSSRNLEYKRTQLLHGLPVTDMPPINLYEISWFMNLLNERYGKDIESHPVLQKITDALFADTIVFFSI